MVILIKPTFILSERCRHLSPMYKTVPQTLSGILISGYYIYAYLGRTEDAVREGRRGAELKPESKDALDGAQIAAFLALIYARSGKIHEAMTLIERLLTTPGAWITSRKALRSLICECAGNGTRSETIHASRKSSPVQSRRQFTSNPFLSRAGWRDYL